MNITYQDVKNSEEVRTYIRQADASLSAVGFTEHSFGHVGKCVETVEQVLTELGYDSRQVELGKIAAYMHDIGNVINRNDHAQSGAVMAFRILDNMGMEPADVAAVITAIGNHDEGTAYPVNAIAAALILADKTDVRRSRVRNSETVDYDIHDRVNYAAVEAGTELDREGKSFSLNLKIDTSICPVTEYFEIFLNRMLLCRRAADFFGLQFKLNINGQNLL